MVRATTSFRTTQPQCLDDDATKQQHTHTNKQTNKWIKTPNKRLFVNVGRYPLTNQSMNQSTNQPNTHTHTHTHRSPCCVFVATGSGRDRLLDDTCGTVVPWRIVLGFGRRARAIRDNGDRNQARNDLIGVRACVQRIRSSRWRDRRFLGKSYRNGI